MVSFTREIIMNTGLFNGPAKDQIISLSPFLGIRKEQNERIFSNRGEICLGKI